MHKNLLIIVLNLLALELANIFLAIPHPTLGNHSKLGAESHSNTGIKIEVLLVINVCYNNQQKLGLVGNCN